MTPARPTDTTPAPSKAARCACVAAVASLSTEQADAQCERGDDKLAPLEQVASDEHGRRAKLAAGRPAPERVRSARVRVVSVGLAGVIALSWHCSARAERRAAADRTGLLHSLSAAARSSVCEPRLQIGRSIDARSPVRAASALDTDC